MSYSKLFTRRNPMRLGHWHSTHIATKVLEYGQPAESLIYCNRPTRRRLAAFRSINFQRSCQQFTKGVCDQVRISINASTSSRKHVFIRCFTWDVIILTFIASAQGKTTWRTKQMFAALPLRSRYKQTHLHESCGQLLIIDKSDV